MSTIEIEIPSCEDRCIYIQVKKKAFKINAKIEDVGLNEDLKSTETRNVHNKPKSQNPTYCFTYL